ncbi:unnamed protein product [Caenorhabditis sp. 36 PRJEB53466]|nr:unnamed protein product [Caenorhabditis sp. 36 PRJEB53466]
MEGKVSEDVEDSKKTAMTWRALKESTDHLTFYCNSYDETTNALMKYRERLKETRKTDMQLMDQLVDRTIDYGTKFGEVGVAMDSEIKETLTWLFKKIGWTPSRVQANIGYTGYIDMLIRYRDLSKTLDRIEVLKEKTSAELEEMGNQWKNLSDMNDKIDELHYRFKLVNVAKILESRAQKDDPLAGFFSLPVLLLGTIFHAETSSYYASLLFRLCKQILAVAEAVQYERDSRNQPIVTTSNVLKGPCRKLSVTSLYASTQIADGNGEVLAPEECIQPIAKDSTLCVVEAQNGESIAPSALCLPIAKDSSMTLNSKESPKPCLENGSRAQDSTDSLMEGQNGESIAPSTLCLPIAKDSSMTLTSKESPKPYLGNGPECGEKKKTNQQTSRK